MARGFQKIPLGNIWFAYKHHEIRDGMLVGKGKNEKPGAIADAAMQLVFVHRRVISPVEFADEFGQLGFTRLCRREDRSGGDPIEWFLAHANTVSTIVDLVGYIAEPPKIFQIKGPIAYAERISGPPKTVFLDYTADLAAKKVEIKKWSMRAKARSLLVDLLNPNIAGAQRFFPGRESTSQIKVRSLIEGIYWHIANLVDSDWSPRRCPECGGFFISTDPRQKYCPAPVTSGRSRCSSRLNVRNFEQRQSTEVK
jgi:hypothetical protein